MFNKFNPNLSKTKDILFQQLKDNEIKVFNHYIKDLAVHRLAVAEGKSSFEYNKNKEFISLVNEIMEI